MFRGIAGRLQAGGFPGTGAFWFGSRLYHRPVGESTYRLGVCSLGAQVRDLAVHPLDWESRAWESAVMESSQEFGNLDSGSLVSGNLQSGNL